MASIGNWTCSSARQVRRTTSIHRSRFSLRFISPHYSCAYAHAQTRLTHSTQHLHARPGYETSFQLPFPIIGRGGLALNDKWAPHPVSYLSVAVDGFPNMFMSLGPNSGVGSGSLLALMEYQVGYAVQATAKLQRERLKSIEVKPEAVHDFDRYLEVSCSLS